MKVKYFDKLYIIDTDYYYHKNSDYIKEQTGEKEKAIQYRKIKDVYVYSINKIWDGSETFDICPVDFSKKENKEKSWLWRRSVEEKDIDVSVFTTMELALKKYNEIPEEKRKEYSEILFLKKNSS